VKTKIRPMAIAVAAGMLLIAGATPAQGDEIAMSNSLESIAAVAPDAISQTANVPTKSNGIDAISATVQLTEVSVPVDPAAGIGLQAGTQTISIGLPFASAADKAVVEKPGVVSFDNNNGSVTVPLVKSDGSVQINTVINNPAAPQRYDYPLALPAGSTIRQESGGILLFDAYGEPLGAIAAPWALDANGESIPTRYEVSGTTLTQVVEHTAKDAYPIVADPTYIAPVAFYYSRSQVEEMWRALNNINGVCSFLPLPYLASLGCTAPASLADAITSAHYQSKRIKALYYQCNSGSWCNYYTYQVIT
jgi:hypothetical protein